MIEELNDKLMLIPKSKYFKCMVSQEDDMNHINDITINSRFKRSVTHVKTYLGADCGLDCHNAPLVTIMKVKLKNAQKRKKCKARKEWKDLNGKQFRRKFLIDVKNRYEVLGKDVSEVENERMEHEWKNLQRKLAETVENVVPEKSPLT